MTNVIELFQEVKANDILEESIDRFDHCMVIGITSDSLIEFRTNIKDGAEVNMLADLIKNNMLNNFMSEE